MKQLKILILLVCIPMLAFSIDVFESNLIDAKRKAATEGKIIMLDFTAEWCSPCKFMEAHTFTDSRVNNYFNSSVVPVRIDIDNFDGFALKETYGVQVLPTIIILNSKGELLQKYEESMPPSRLLEIMERYDEPHNKVITIVEPEPTPEPEQTITYDAQPTAQHVPYNESIVPTPTETTSVVRPSLEPTYQPSVPTILPAPIEVVATEPEPSVAPTMVETSPEPLPAPVFSEEAPLVNTVGKPVVTGEGLFRFVVEVQPSTGYSVQIGAFYQYENVLVQVSQLQQQFEHIIVSTKRLNDKPVYKILLGHFDDAEEARLFAEKLDMMGMGGSFSVDLRTF